jgi:hypothetical protein
MTPAPVARRVDGLEERGYTLFAGPIGCLVAGRIDFPLLCARAISTGLPCGTS